MCNDHSWKQLDNKVQQILTLLTKLWGKFPRQAQLPLQSFPLVNQSLLDLYGSTLLQKPKRKAISHWTMKSRTQTKDLCDLRGGTIEVAGEVCNASKVTDSPARKILL